MLFRAAMPRDRDDPPGSERDDTVAHEIRSSPTARGRARDEGASARRNSLQQERSRSPRRPGD